MSNNKISELVSCANAHKDKKDNSIALNEMGKLAKKDLEYIKEMDNKKVIIEEKKFEEIKNYGEDLVKSIKSETQDVPEMAELGMDVMEK